MTTVASRKIRLDILSARLLASSYEQVRTFVAVELDAWLGNTIFTFTQKTYVNGSISYSILL